MTDKLVSIHLWHDPHDPVYRNGLRVTFGYDLGDRDYTLPYPRSEIVLEAVARMVMQACLLQLQLGDMLEDRLSSKNG
jgi:hypothetical protein